jgi:hypothetical protein
MHKTLQVLRLAHVPAKAHRNNIKQILDSMDVYDTRADRAHQRGNFSLATRYSNFVMALDGLVANYNGKLPERTK